MLTKLLVSYDFCGQAFQIHVYLPSPGTVKLREGPLPTRTGNMGRMTRHPLLQPSGRLVTKFGSRGSELDQLAGPHYAATNSLGNIIVSDFHNHNIKVATSATTTDELSH